MTFTGYYDSPLGGVLLTSDGESLTGLRFDGRERRAVTAGEGTGDIRGLPLFKAVSEWLDVYFAGQNPGALAVPLAPAGSGFQKSVQNRMSEIPYGSVTTYGEIARQIGCKSAQAVGGAVGRNPISIIIPCHRVIGSNGGLTGYGGGIPRKIKLLELEGIDVGGFWGE
jgi:methylated-DNA-[protein]-cysteine S-methyltransferase